MNTLFLNATTDEAYEFIAALGEQGHTIRIANSFQSAVHELQGVEPDVIVLDASLEFSSTDALLYLRNMYSGNIVAYGSQITVSTKNFLTHLGITHIVQSINDLSPLFYNEPDVEVSERAV